MSFTEKNLVPNAGLLPAAALAHTAVLRTGAAGSLFDDTRAPSTVGSWLRAHKWSNVRELDAVSRQLLGRLRGRGAGSEVFPDRDREPGP